MRLNHHFYLIDRRACEAAKINWQYDDRVVELHDDFLSYLWDSLMWIPTSNPNRGNQPCMGLNRWGNTILNYDGAALAQTVFNNWANLLRVAPKCFSYEETIPGTTVNLLSLDVTSVFSIHVIKRSPNCDC